MLESIKISGYRSCLNTVFNPQPGLSVLIGPNGSGKTNVLRAILLLKKAMHIPFPRDFEELSAADDVELQIELRHEKRRSTLTAVMSLYVDENNDDVVLQHTPAWRIAEFASGKTTKLNLDSGDFIGYDWPFFGKKRTLLFSGPDIDKKYLGDFKSMAHFFDHMEYYGAAQFANPAECPVSFVIEREDRRIKGLNLDSHSKFLFALYNRKKSEPEAYQKFFNVVGPSGLGLLDKIHFEEVEASQTDVTVRSGGRLRKQSRVRNLVIPQFHIGRNVLSPSQLSEGTFRTIALFFHIMTDDSSALLIEEPEVCVHRGLLSSLVELIKIYSEQKQIIMSTHSDFVLDQVEPRNVYKVLRSAKTGTKVSQVEESLSAKELAALKIYLNEEGNLGEYWRHGGLG